jgi:DAK2 domain fusion protein YloV
MRYRHIDGRMLVRLTEAGTTWLRTNQQSVNNLNVYPVPDGDTGTNMLLTMQAALKEVESQEQRSIGRALHALAHGALMGARGNSGVILSQLWRGFARVLEHAEEMDAPAFVRGLMEARETAYRGVGEPVEGTILTVSTAIANAAQQALQNGATSNLDILEAAVQAADVSVENTPNLLPILKQAGVVDAGGKGLFIILEGILRAAMGEALDIPLMTIGEIDFQRIGGVTEVIEPGQDWEVVVDFRPAGSLDLHSFAQELTELGTSIQLGEGDGIVRMHIHVLDQTEYQAIEFCKKKGTVVNVHIENLMDQMDSVLKLTPIEDGQLAVVAVVSGAGMARVMADFGVAALIKGGQTMNPSTEQILAAVEALPTDRVIVLPNNKNIILAAKQAADLSAKQVRVVPTRSMPQGIAALLSHQPDGGLVETAEAMAAAVQEVKTGELTRASRAVVIDQIEVNEGQVIALLDDKLVCACDDLSEATLSLLKHAEAEAAELITLYYGAGLSHSEASTIADRVRETYSAQELQLVHGGQPHYDLIVSVE